MLKDFFPSFMQNGAIFSKMQDAPWGVKKGSPNP